MSDFAFLQNPISKKWLIAAPHRADRPDDAHGKILCPFCVGLEDHDPEVYRMPYVADGKKFDSIYPASTATTKADWSVRVVKNRYPFAPIHEVIIHSPDHKRSFSELPQYQAVLILETYRHRYNEHHRHGQVYIFHNHGQKAGESLRHPHTQLAVLPEKVYLDIPHLASVAGDMKLGIETEHFVVFCPTLSSWPDEVWITPKRPKTYFGEITDVEIADLSHILGNLIHLYDLRHGREFAFNFYIYPSDNWYMRLIPRVKTFGGFEVGTGVMVNTQMPKETMEFIKEHFHTPDVEKILNQHQAQYHRGV
jgi:UDPglucose--hexose-1-phosphate uridylyltransferase